jgi:hypothetical protein
MSLSTGQVGTYGVIGETTFDRVASIDGNSRKTRYAPFVPHSSTGAGGAPVSNASPYRHVPIDYNACKSFSVSNEELSYFQNASTKQEFSPHSSTGAIVSSVGTMSQSRYAPTDYNSCKSFSLSADEMPYYLNTAAKSASSGNNKSSVELLKAAPFVPHSSTGAGEAPMSPASPSFYGGRYQ